MGDQLGGSGGLGVGDGPREVDAFEREFAAHLGMRHALAVNGGSSALICGLIGAFRTKYKALSLAAILLNGLELAAIIALIFYGVSTVRHH